jgi:hypothetical protein
LHRHRPLIQMIPSHCQNRSKGMYDARILFFKKFLSWSDLAAVAARFLLS